MIAEIIPDDQMPRDREDRPFEMLANPAGVPTRTNPAQMVEAALGKIAEKTGRPEIVHDFTDDRDWAAYARDRLRRAGLSDLEDVIDPTTGRKIPRVFTGSRFMMKLAHQAEGKAQGRGSGEYTAEGTPAKGGPTGCLTGDTVLVVEDHPPSPDFGHIRHMTIREIVESKYRGSVRGATPPAGTHPNHWHFDWQTIEDHFHEKVPAGDVVTVELTNGLMLSGTKQHEVYLKDGSKALLGDLRPGDQLL